MTTYSESKISDKFWQDPPWDTTWFSTSSLIEFLTLLFHSLSGLVSWVAKFLKLVSWYIICGTEGVFEMKSTGVFRARPHNHHPHPPIWSVVPTITVRTSALNECYQLLTLSKSCFESIGLAARNTEQALRIGSWSSVFVHGGERYRHFLEKGIR